MRTVPFTIGDGFDEETRIRGRLTCGSASVVLELLTDAQGVDLVAPRKVVIGLEEICGCRFRRGLWVDRLQLRVSHLAALGGVPGAALDVVTLRFAKTAREEATMLAQRLLRGPSRRGVRMTVPLQLAPVA